MRILWSPKAQRYRTEKGRFISRASVLVELERVRDGYKERVISLSTQLQEGKLNQPGWVLGVKEELKAMHLTSAAVAKGGLKQMSPADRGRLGQQIKVQMQFLRGFERQIASGEQPLNGRFLQRVGLYINATRGTFVEAERRMKEASGVKRAKRVLSAKESCAGCVEEASKGFVLIGEIAPIGSKECRVNCQCDVIYEKAA